MNAWRAPAAALVLVLACAGCASSSRSDEDYRRKAAKTAEAAASAVRTAEIGVRAAGDGKATGPYLSALLNEADKDLNEVAGGFMSRQPPGGDADKVRERTGKLLDQAVDVLDDLRIAVRRGQIGRLPEVGKDLPQIADRLESLDKELA
ncbi:hypothetical protein [Actinomadura macrotermitis]|uniref:Uncharacterized protein n=1 Tax=Actinomadura macrotermitis TaxID=2585200 RepID=A0A7K0BUW6_9ACTN|nr:hypothetical protein [Actinomadura macrotermitis]MQY04682.1 hypothetical protein [Actinomadura macrotermitis]